MIHPLLRNRKFWLLAGLALAAPLVLYKVLAQSTAPAPIDFENGPLIAKNNPSNVVLALSVEWPTSGGAYKDATYVDGKEYIGYFNSSRCYTYPGYANVPRTTSSFVVNSDYFTPTGNTSASYQCNLSGTGTGFSGNYLNYATMSAPDMLRMALTGGDRGIDDQTLTVLDRGTVFSSANFRRAVGSTLTALVTPFNNGAALYAYNCRDEVIFTTSNTKTCANPDVADATDLRPVVASSVTASGTTTTTPTVPPINQVGTTWTDTGSYTLAAPTIGPVTPVTFYTTTFALTTTVPVASAESPATVRTSTYTVSGTSTTVPLAAAETPAVIRGYAATGTSTTTPPAAAESPAVVRGYVVNGTSTTAPPAAAESPSVIRGYTITGTTTAIPPTAAEPVPVIRGFTYTVLGTSTVAPVGGAPVVVVGNIWAPSGALTLDYQGGGAPNTTNNFTVVTTGTRYCFLTAAPRRITLGPATGITSTNCSALGSTRSGSLNAGDVVVRYVNYTGTPIYNTYTATPFYNAYTPFYRSYAPFYNSYTAYYNSYTRNDFYYSYTSYTAYRVYKEQAVWNVYTATAKAIVKPRVQVCDSTEGPTRTVVYGTGTTDFYNYCTKYEVGGTVGYKPEGQIQQKSDSLRLAVFSYLMDGGTRDGGVLRAPMKYVGPNKYDDNGSLVTNPEKEWSVTTGQFVAKPITDSVSTSYTYTGVINYLNRFGKTGNYKSLDPVGELWYESLRYLQGLQPSAGTTDGMTDAMKDGYPVYSTWTDPVTSACQRRNYILGIGDTNTHYDRSIPGVTRAQQTTLFNESPNVYDITYATTPTINGSTDALDSHYWTQRVDAFERDGVAALTYTDALGRSQSTAGNLLRNNTLGNLDTTNTGSGGHSSYHWVGLSYWANTQAIRKDTKNGAVMDKVRVKTFMIDVDENNRGAIDANVKKTSYYLAGKYGYFDDKAENGNPFNGSDDSRWAETDGSPGGYVLASQPRRLIAGIKRFFDASARGGGSFATVAVSSNSFAANSRDGKSFEPSFVPGQWSGTIKSVELTLNTATNTLTSGSVTWDAGEILTAASRASGTVTLPQVRPQDRKIVTYLQGTTPASATFTWTELNSQTQALLNATPYSSTTDALGEARVNYLRGDRTKELDETFRPRASIVGDIINSGPVFKGGANDEITGADYDAFVRNNLTRTPVVYTGANDGMLHAFNANTGQELFAYVPGALLPKLNVLTSKNYIHTAYVDAVPVVDEVKTSAGWKTILASGMGGGAQGIFALDVTNPTAFNKDNVMFEFTDRDDPMMGNVVAPPKLVKMLKQGSSPAVYEYYIVVSSGYNNYKPDGTGTFTLTPAQALFFLSVNKPIGSPWALGTNYFKVELPANAAVGAAVGLAQPGIRFGSAGEAIEFFSGDLQGRLWKVGFSSGISAAAVAGTSPLLKPVYEPSPGVQRPLFTASIGTATQAITSSPVIYPYATGGNMVIFGTGRLFEAADRSTTNLNSIYGVWDSGQSASDNYNRARSNLQQMTINTTTLVISGSTPTFSASSTKSGWYLDLPRAKERVVIDGVASLGKVNINSTIPPASECSDNGDSLAYFLRPSNGTAALQTQGEIGGYRGKSINIEIDLSTATASSYSNRSNSGRRTATVKSASSTSVSTQNGTLSPKTYSVDSYLATGRIYWREIKDFNQTNP
jgi:type IV pilus assembly protein PilY1